MKQIILSLCLFASSILASFASCDAAIIADLNSDWSDVANPNITVNGTWTYRGGATALPQFGDWTPLGAALPQPAWAPTTPGIILPAIFKSTTDVFDWLTGDVIIHSTDAANGIDTETANIVWTSSVNAIVNLDGNAWMGRDFGRGNDWSLLLNGNVLSTGHIESGDAFSRSAPFSFLNGSGGAAALSNLSIVAGDQIALQVARTSLNGDFVGVNLSINAVPEPSSALLMGATGLLVAYRFRSTCRNHAGSLCGRFGF